MTDNHSEYIFKSHDVAPLRLRANKDQATDYLEKKISILDNAGVFIRPPCSPDLINEYLSGTSYANCVAHAVDMKTVLAEKVTVDPAVLQEVMNDPLISKVMKADYFKPYMIEEIIHFGGSKIDTGRLQPYMFKDIIDYPSFDFYHIHQKDVVYDEEDAEEYSKGIRASLTQSGIVTDIKRSEASHYFPMITYFYDVSKIANIPYTSMDMHFAALHKHNDGHISVSSKDGLTRELKFYENVRDLMDKEYPDVYRPDIFFVPKHVLGKQFNIVPHTKASPV